MTNEEESHRTCKSKKLCHDMFDVQGNVTFSGKIDIYPFIIEELVKGVLSIELQEHLRKIQ